MDSQSAEMHKEVKQITNRRDEVQEKGVYYIHFPLYEIEFTYRDKVHEALVDGFERPHRPREGAVSAEFRAKTLTAMGAFGGVGAAL